MPTLLEGVVLIQPRVFPDARGFFLETWNARDFAAAGLRAEFVQDSHSRSTRGVSGTRGWITNIPIMPNASCVISSACGWYMCVPCWRSVNS